jgi:hypothetical protein
MSCNEIWKIVLGIITSIGGIGVIIIAFSKYIGNIFADKYVMLQMELDTSVKKYYSLTN